MTAARLFDDRGVASLHIKARSARRLRLRVGSHPHRSQHEQGGSYNHTDFSHEALVMVGFNRYCEKIETTTQPLQ